MIKYSIMHGAHCLDCLFGPWGLQFTLQSDRTLHSHYGLCPKSKQEVNAEDIHHRIQNAITRTSGSPVRPCPRDLVRLRGILVFDM